MWLFTQNQIMARPALMPKPRPRPATICLGVWALSCSLALIKKPAMANKPSIGQNNPSAPVFANKAIIEPNIPPIPVPCAEICHDKLMTVTKAIDSVIPIIIREISGNCGILKKKNKVANV